MIKVEQPLLMMVMKVTNIYKHEIVDTRAKKTNHVLALENGCIPIFERILCI